MKKKITIAQLEVILKNEEDISVDILPNGEIRVLTDKERAKLKKDNIKPITMKEDLGGEYGIAA